MAVRARGKGFQADFKLPGWSRVRETFSSHAEATAYEMEARAAHALGKPCPSPLAAGSVTTQKAMTIFDLAEHCEKKRWAKLESRHAELAPRNAYLFAYWVGPKLPVAAALTEAKLGEYVEHRENVLGNSGGTINRHMAALSVLIKEAVKLRLIDHAIELPKRKEGQTRLRVFSESEERLMFRTVEQWGYLDYLDLFTFLIDTGCRLGETRKLRWDDFEGRHIVLERDITKNSTQRVLTATPRVMEALARLKDKYGDHYGPFAWVEDASLRTLWNRLRGHFPWMDEHTVVHTFRHTCASRLVRRGVDLYRVQIWMGHKSIQMTQRYAKFAPKQLGELADVLAGYNPETCDTHGDTVRPVCHN